MHDPSAALQKALVARLGAAVPALGGRVHDHAPHAVAYPFVQFGASQCVADDAECLDGATTYFTLHLWARSGPRGSVECRQISDAIAAALQGWLPDLSADGFAAGLIKLNSAQTARSADAETTQTILTIEAFTERLQGD